MLLQAVLSVLIGVSIPNGIYAQMVLPETEV